MEKELPILTKENIVEVFTLFLIRKDGKINSPALKKENSKNILKFIDENYKNISHLRLSDKWYYIKNNLNEIPKCICGNEIKNFSFNIRFCSQKCAVTSDEARKRVSKQMSNRIYTKEQRLKKSNNMKKIWSNDEYKNKLKIILKEANKNNGKNFLNENNEPWNKNLTKETSNSLREGGKKISISGKGKHSGKQNGMFGKSPSKYCGRGIKGYFNKIWFRSSLELFYLIYFFENNIKFKSAEINEFMVEYLHPNGNIKSYHPDFYLIDTDEIIEIKPYGRLKDKIFQIKMNALKEKFKTKNCKFMTELNIDFSYINKKYITKLVNNKLLNISNKELLRLYKNIN